MAFKDEDVKSMKANLKRWADVNLGTKEANALIARLEAAEIKAQLGELLHGPKRCSGWCDFCAADERWRTAAGK